LAPKRRIVAVDLFCGAGGLTKGLTMAGIDVRLGIDADESSRDVYERNNKKATFWCKKIENIKGKEILEFINLKQNDLFLLAVCAPCQPFSKRNKKRLDKNHLDERKNLLTYVIKIMKGMPRKPDFIFAENVPGFERNPVFVEFEDYLHRLEFALDFGVVNAADYGTPQSRKRLILIARNDDFIEMPKPSHGIGLKPFVTVREAFKGLPPTKAGGSSSKVANHYCRNLTEINLSRLAETPKSGGSRTDWKSENLFLDCHKRLGRKEGHKDVYGRMDWDKPAPTLTTRCVSLSNGRFGHPSQDRAISVREAARLQGFPDTYKFYGPGIDAEARHIGNAVPVTLAKAFGKHFVKCTKE